MGTPSGQTPAVGGHAVVGNNADKPSVKADTHVHVDRRLLPAKLPKGLEHRFLHLGAPEQRAGEVLGNRGLCIRRGLRLASSSTQFRDSHGHSQEGLVSQAAS